ncbi:MAG: DUF92 domain-containing protein [Gemmatimonadaceae bacterium]
MIARVAAALVIAAAIAIAARAARALSQSGAIAATIIGTVSITAGWSWAALLLAFFVSSSALSRLGVDIKQRRTSGIGEKGGPRDAVQVLANGGIFGIAAVGAVISPSDAWMAVGAGALAASTADTWATEVGTLVGKTPRLVTSWRPVPPGTSGAVTGAGILGMLGGSAFLTLCTAAVVWPRHVAAATLVGGVAGALVDTLAGATVQSRRRCISCDAATERTIHSCGTSTVHAGGIPWLTNDAVNVLCGAAGAMTALAVAQAL